MRRMKIFAVKFIVIYGDKKKAYEKDCIIQKWRR